jgi:hypothetical protein
MPVAWRGTLAQYAGRLRRLHDAKREVVIYEGFAHGMPEPEVEKENERPLRSSRSDLIDAASTLGAVDQIGIDPLA